MTTTHYKSPDEIIEIITTTDDHRFPRHEAKMAVIKMKPTAHSRCRQQWGGVTLMLTHNEIHGLLKAVQACEPGFSFEWPVTLENKPESRKKAWETRNRLRVAKLGKGRRW